MENSGWIYFRVVEGRGYCFGKTDSPSRRDSEYRKENPWVEKIYDFFVEDMHAVEADLIERTKEFRLLENSKEWIRLCDEAREIMDGVREQYALMSYTQWEQLRSEKGAAGRLATEQEHEGRLQQLQAEIQQLVGQLENLTNDVAYARQIKEVAAALDQQLIRSRMPLLNRNCPNCQIPLTYNAALTGYRCGKCNDRWD